MESQQVSAVESTEVKGTAYVYVSLRTVITMLLNELDLNTVTKMLYNKIVQSEDKSLYVVKDIKYIDNICYVLLIDDISKEPSLLKAKDFTIFTSLGVTSITL